MGARALRAARTRAGRATSRRGAAPAADGRSQGAGSFGGNQGRGDYGDSYGGGAYGGSNSRFGSGAGGSGYGGSNSGGGTYGGGHYGTGTGPDWSTGGGYGGDTSFGARGGWSGGATGGGQSLRESYAGRGPKDYKRSDDRIREDVSDRLEQDHSVDASDITVQVMNGEVTLTGTVSGRDQKRRAEDCAEAVNGVKEVTNNLRLNRNAGQGGSHGQASASEMSSSILGLGGQHSRENEDANTGSTAASSGSAGTGATASSSGKQSDSAGKQSEATKSGKTNSGSTNTPGTPNLSA